MEGGTMRKVHKGVLVILTGVITMFLAAGSAWAQSATPTSSGTASGGTTRFIEGTTNDMRTVNPWKAIESPEYEVLSLNFDLIENFNKDDLSAAPGFATSWTQSDDGLTWTFDIRQGATWQDGQPLTADDVAFTFNQTLDCQLGNSLDYVVPKFTKSIEATSPTTLVWTTSAPTIAPIRPPWVYIVPEHIWGNSSCDDVKKAPFFENNDNCLSGSECMIGSGPFQLTEWNKGESWTMTANPNYWGGSPQIDEFTVVKYDNPEAMVNALKNGEIDYAGALPVDLFQQVQGEGPSSGISTHVGPAISFDQMSFNMCDPTAADAAPYCAKTGSTGNPALRDPQLRTAIAWAIDKQTLVDKVLAGYGAVGTTIVPPFASTYHWEPTGDQVIGFDIQHANDLLDQAGYKDTDGDGVRNDPKTGDNLDFRLILRSESDVGPQDGDYVEGWLKQIGIKTEPQVLTDNKLVSAWYDNDYDLYIWGWGPDPDPDFMLSTFTSHQCGIWSDTCYSNPDYDKLYTDQQTTRTIQDRVPIVQQMQQIIYTDIPEVILYYDKTLEAYNSAKWQGLEDNISPTPEGYLWGQYTPYTALTLAPRGSDTGGGSSSSSSSTLLIVGILGAIIVIIGIVMIARRGRSDEDLA
jgi:peptide/nickel transport system substrate-binding protein